MNTKTCNTCKVIKPMVEMVKNNRIKCGYSSICKKCLNNKNNTKEQQEKTKLRSRTYKAKNQDKIRSLNERYRLVNVEKIREYQKTYRLKNTEKLREYKEEWNRANPEYQKHYNNEYYAQNKEYIKAQSKTYVHSNRDKVRTYFRTRKSNDSLFKLRHTIGNSILKAFKRNGFSKNSKTVGILGCSFLELKTHLESKFEPWMNWHNHGLYNGEFNFGWDIDHIIPTSSASSEADLLILNHYTNLQPLCSKTNRDIKKDNCPEQHLQPLCQVL